jgi:hypothetical protein
MSDEKTAILIRALEASGSEREAQLARAILGDPAAAAPEAPAAAAAAAPVAPTTPTGPQPPPGKQPLLNQADVEGLSQGEYEARHDEVQAALAGDA